MWPLLKLELFVLPPSHLRRTAAPCFDNLRPLRRRAFCVSAPRHSQSTYKESRFQRVRLEQNLNLKGWNSQAHSRFPEQFESTNLGRDNLSREIGPRRLPKCGLTAVFKVWPKENKAGVRSKAQGMPKRKTPLSS